MTRAMVPGKHQEVIAFAPPGKELLLERRWKSYCKALGKVIGGGTQGTFTYSHVQTSKIELF